MKIPPNDAGTFQNGMRRRRAVSAWREVSHSHLTPSTRTPLNISNPNGRGAPRDWILEIANPSTEQEAARSQPESGPPRVLDPAEATFRSLPQTDRR